MISVNKYGKISLKTLVFSKIAESALYSDIRNKSQLMLMRRRKDNDGCKQLAKMAYETWEFEESYATIIMVNHRLSA